MGSWQSAITETHTVKVYFNKAYVIFSNPYVLSTVGLEVYISDSMALCL